LVTKVKKMKESRTERGGQRNRRVNPYMKCGWKKVEPPTKKVKNLRD